jgi:hypothetical protein
MKALNTTANPFLVLFGAPTQAQTDGSSKLKEIFR